MTKYVVAASISNRVSVFSYPYVAQGIFDPNHMAPLDLVQVVNMLLVYLYQGAM